MGVADGAVKIGRDEERVVKGVQRDRKCDGLKKLI
jgi:hypothetical protein